MEGILEGKRIASAPPWRCCDGSEDEDDAVVPMLLEAFPVFPNGADALCQLFGDLRRLPGKLGQRRRDRAVGRVGVFLCMVIGQG